MTKPEYYILTPVYPTEGFNIVSAAIISCVATGEILSGYGGPSKGLSTKIVDALSTPEVKYIIDEDTIDELLTLASGDSVLYNKILSLKGGK